MYPFSASTIREEPSDHSNNCYFCITPPVRKWLLCDIQTFSVPHKEEIPVLDALESFSLKSDKEDNVDKEENEYCSLVSSLSNVAEFDLESFSQPHSITQRNSKTL